MAFMLGITPWPVATASLRIGLILSALYLARTTAHKAIQAMARAFPRGFRTASNAVSCWRENLANNSSLHRSLDESIKRIEDVHHQSVNVLPDPPAWVKAVKAIAKIDEREGRSGVGNGRPAVSGRAGS